MANEKPGSALDADLALLTTLLSQDNLDETDEANVAALLSRLESADGVAQGMEHKLDSLLGNLDTLLATLEPQDQTVAADKTNGSG